MWDRKGMKHASALLTGSILLLCAFSEVTNAPESFAQDFPYQYNIKVELVGFYASVFDRVGKLVNDLSQNDFILSENGKPQILSQFSREYISLSIIFLLDTSGSMDGEKLSNAGKSLLQFLKHLNRGDEAMLMEFRSKPWVVEPFTRDFGQIENDLKGLEGSGSTALYDAILAALDQMHNQYSLGYYPPKTTEGEWRAIKLETKTRGLRVIASKTGYFASGKDR